MFGEILKKVLTHFSLNDSATSFGISKIITFSFFYHLSVSPKTCRVGVVTPVLFSLIRLSNSSLWFWVLETNPATRTQNLNIIMDAFELVNFSFHILKFCIEFSHLLQDTQVGSQRCSLGEREDSVIRRARLCLFPECKTQFQATWLARRTWGYPRRVEHYLEILGHSRCLHEHQKTLKIYWTTIHIDPDMMVKCNNLR